MLPRDARRILETMGRIVGARIEVEGFRPIVSEVALVDMQLTNGTYKPLLGDIVLEQASIAVDMLGHRSLARHLQATLRTGTSCTYVPDPRVPAIWES